MTVQAKISRERTRVGNSATSSDRASRRVNLKLAQLEVWFGVGENLKREDFVQVWQRRDAGARFWSFHACVLRAHGGAGYTFGALAILVVLLPGKKPSRAQLCARSVPVTAIRLPPGSTASAQGDVGDIWGG